MSGDGQERNDHPTNCITHHKACVCGEWQHAHEKAKLTTDLATAQRDAGRWESHYKDAVGTAKHFESRVNKLEAELVEEREKNTGACYIVTAKRWGKENTHAYLVGVFNWLEQAEDAVEKEEAYRGGKYSCEIARMKIITEWEAEPDMIVEKHAVKHPHFKSEDALARADKAEALAARYRETLIKIRQHIAGQAPHKRDMNVVVYGLIDPVVGTSRCNPDGVKQALDGDK